MRPGSLLPIKEIAIATLLGGDRAQERRLLFRMAATAAQVIEANVGNDSIDPGEEGAFEAEAVQIAVDLQEGLLIDVPRVFGAAQPVGREPQDLPVVALHEQVESGAVAGLGALDKRPVVRGRKD